VPMSLMKRINLFFIIALVITLVAPLCPPGYTQSSAQLLYFEETGHTVRGAFLEFFQTHGGVEIFGYPLTEEFIENGRRVQYFQRARMEWHPENPPPYKVQLGLLGELLGRRQPPIPPSEIPPPNHPQRRYYPQTGHTVSFAFLTYYDTHGGLDIFGYPITEFLYENGYIVQYFQRARMEWHPENPPDKRVQLGLLGEEYIDMIRLSPELLNPVPPPPQFSTPTSTRRPVPAAMAVTAINATASVKYAITGQGGYQTVYVYVTDQRRRGVPGAQVNFVAHYHSGDRYFTMPPTDASGYTHYQFSLGNPLPGYIVIIDVTVTYGHLRTTTQTSFLPWW